MRTSMLSLAMSLVLAALSRAGHEGESTIWVTRLTGHIDRGWVSLFPTHSSDFFSVAHPVDPGERQ